MTAQNLARRALALAALATISSLLALTAPQAASSANGGIGPGTSGGGSGGGDPVTPGAKAKLEGRTATVPAKAPNKVKRAIRAANRIVKGKPYCLGGGHGRWNDKCYDCSGSISYALGKKGARVLKAPMPSGSFTNWQKRGRGKWITVYANGGHMYAVIAGLRLDTSMTAGDGPGWSTEMRSGRGYSKRHPRGL